MRFSLLASCLGAFLLTGCQTDAADDTAAAPPSSTACATVADVEGVYACTGQCVVTEAAGTKNVITINVTDSLSVYPGSDPGSGLYSIAVSAGDFRETEIGALVGLTMRTATSEVSDNNFPVLEELLFETSPTCAAERYTKVVRNPTQDQFKACSLVCTKS